MYSIVDVASEVSVSEPLYPHSRQTNNMAELWVGLHAPQHV